MLTSTSFVCKNGSCCSPFCVYPKTCPGTLYIHYISVNKYEVFMRAARFHGTPWAAAALHLLPVPMVSGCGMNRTILQAGSAPCQIWPFMGADEHTVWQGMPAGMCITHPEPTKIWPAYHQNARAHGWKRIPLGIPFHLPTGMHSSFSSDTSHHLGARECGVGTGVMHCPCCLATDKCICHPCLVQVVIPHCCPSLLCFLMEGAVETLSDHQQAKQHLGILVYLCPFLAILFLFSVFRSHQEAKVQFLCWLQRLHDSSCNCWQV